MGFLQNIFQRFRRRPIRIATGSTSTFPVLSHTFVYQELTAMHRMFGADVKLFHTQVGDNDQLHAAFRYLDENRQHFESDYERHVARTPGAGCGG